ncbi:glycerophosphodiester phosphodiesterase family protein [Companilactobacillus formosensis]|uniref:glycerophosphodiester phosphodiesterase family protein n=1 Tax=Companilactobacillus formosensis TaxID=1617889 RepID=UPI000E658B68|nr:glycerophosphodiester phosphodiesterase family protein [Companilactobacillus formosensis]
MKINNRQIEQKLREKAFLILVHRGSHGGNIIENTSDAVKVALLQHADMVEIDISKSSDGNFYIFHDGGEKRLLHELRNIKKLTSQEIESKLLHNSLDEPIDKKIESFDYFYNHVNHNTLINIDRSWEYWETFLPFLDNYSEMHEYFVLKSPPKREYLRQLSNHHIKYLYFPIITDLKQLEILEEFPDLNLVGLEIIEPLEGKFRLIDSPKIDAYRCKDLMLLSNSIKLNDRTKLFSGLDDNVALLEGPQFSWESILKTGINAIQTDWPDILNQYRQTL